MELLIFSSKLLEKLSCKFSWKICQVKQCVFLLMIYWGLISSLQTKAQEFSLDNVRKFSITYESDTIQFIKIDADTLYSKPTILYCQGSLPLPLIEINKRGEFIVAVNNFDYRMVAEKYNIIIISMPHTPIVADSSQVNPHFAYVPDISKPYHYDMRYLEDNYLEKYVERGNAVIQFLRERTWVDKNRIILLGHSQGSHVAANLAAQNPDINALGYFSGNVLGRFSERIFQERDAAKTGRITEEAAQSNIEILYQWWQKLCRGISTDTQTDPAHTWKSFSKSGIECLTSLQMPVYITYGTKDSGAQLCDILPIYFELAGKTNYKLRPFIGCGHNFEEISLDGRSNWDKMYWDKAVKEFISWCENINK